MKPLSIWQVSGVIVCGCHLIPSFVNGKSTELLSADSEDTTKAWPDGGCDDWAKYYIGI